MFIRNPIKKYKILANENSNDKLQPRILKENIVKDRDGRDKSILTIKLFCRIDLDAADEVECEKIDARLSSKDLSFYRTLGKMTQTNVVAANILDKEVSAQTKENTTKLSLRSSKRQQRRKERRRKARVKKEKNKISSKNRLTSGIRSKVILDTKALVKSSRNSANFMLSKNNDIYESAKKIGSFNIARAKLTNALSGDRKILQIKPLNDRIDQTFKKINETNLDTFLNTYNNLIDSDVDPIKYYENPVGKASFNQERKGIKCNTVKVPLFFKTINNTLIEEINLLSQQKYQFKKIEKTESYKIIEIVGTISKDELLKVGKNGYILFIAKTLGGLNIQAQSVPFNVKTLTDQINEQSTSVKLSTLRKPTGVSKLTVSNLDNKNNVSIDIEAKTINRSQGKLDSFYKKIASNIGVFPKNTTVLNDGVLNANPRRPINFNKSSSIFYRSTLNYRDKQYQNSKSISSKGMSGNRRSLNFPNLKLIAKIDENGRGFNVNIYDITENVVAVCLKKYRFNGSSKGKLLHTKDLEGKNNEFSYLEKTSGKQNINFFDSDVFEEKTYMYVVECIMSNGERKLASSYFIEKFEARTETVLISDINVVDESFDNSESFTRDNFDEPTRSISINFKIEKIENEVDKVIKNMFGNLFDIFSDELKKVKDAQGLVYSIEIQRINNASGDSQTIGKITANESGMCFFEDREAPLFSDVTYKLIPRVKPASEAISSINAQLNSLAKYTISKSVNFVSAAARSNARNRNDKVFSAKRNKFNDRQLFKKGLIRDPKKIVQSSGSDIFADASTGDISYIELNGRNRNTSGTDVVISNGEVLEIQHALIERESYDSIVKKYYDLSFSVEGDSAVDFYAVFIKEGNNVYLDGAAHSNDNYQSIKSYSYLIEHTGTQGVVEYYVVPFLKTGRILLPKLVTAQIIE